MTELMEKRSVTDVVEYAPALPADILAMERRLIEVCADVKSFRRLSDGLLFGVVGIDGMVSVIPVAGEIYSVYVGTVLMQEAIKSKCSLGTKLSGLALMGVDVAVGAIPGGGDVFDLFFRSHAWFAGMIVTEAETKLAQIGETRQRLPSLSEDAAQKVITALRDSLFHNGRTELFRFARMGVVALLCLYGLHQCRAAQEARQESIRQCEARGGWLCSTRY